MRVQSAEALTRFMTAKRRDMPHQRSWLEMYKVLHVSPGRFVRDAEATTSFPWDFDECNEWCRSFRTLTPIMDRRFAESILRAWKNSGVAVNLELLPGGALHQPGRSGQSWTGTGVLYRCTCSYWLHYLICKHSYQQAVNDKLVESALPETEEDATPSASDGQRRGRGGQTKMRAKKGGALGREQFCSLYCS